MREELEKKIKSINYKGLKRVITLVKLCLQEMPRLVFEIQSNKIKVQKKGVNEAHEIIQLMNREIGQSDIAEFNASVNDPVLFPPQEWELYQAVVKLVKNHSHLLKAKSTKKRPRTYPKV